MNEIIVAVLASCNNYAHMRQNGHLTEYEVLMYEHLCRFVETWSKAHELVCRGNWYDLEQQVDLKRQEYEKWLNGQDDSEASPAG